MTIDDMPPQQRALTERAVHTLVISYMLNRLIDENDGNPIDLTLDELAAQATPIRELAVGLYPPSDGQPERITIQAVPVGDAYEWVAARAGEGHHVVIAGVAIAGES